MGFTMLFWLMEASTSQPFSLFSLSTHIHWPDERYSSYGPTPELNNNASLVLYNVVGPNTTFTSFGFKAPVFWVEKLCRWGSRLEEILDFVYALEMDNHIRYMIACSVSYICVAVALFSKVHWRRTVLIICQKIDTMHWKGSNKYKRDPHSVRFVLNFAI